LGPGARLPLDEFAALLAPDPAVHDPTKSVQETLREAADIGLLESRDEEEPRRFGLALSTPPEDARDGDIEAFFVRELRRLVLAPVNNAPLFGAARSQNAKSREFTRIQAWLLHQDPAHGSLNWADKVEHRNVQELQKKSLADGLVGNDVRWRAFRRWSLFLGLSRQDGHNGVIADPTKAVTDELAHLDDVPREIPLVDLRARLAERLPVIDGGVYRREVGQYMQADEDQRTVSPALAFALLRAQRAGSLRFERHADFSGGSFTVAQMAVTHVAFPDK
jgi:hypothetical protein